MQSRSRSRHAQLTNSTFNLLVLREYNCEPFEHAGDGQGAWMARLSGSYHLSYHILVSVRPVEPWIAKLNVPLTHMEEEMQLGRALPGLYAACNTTC